MKLLAHLSMIIWSKDINFFGKQRKLVCLVFLFSYPIKESFKRFIFLFSYFVIELFPFSTFYILLFWSFDFQKDVYFKSSNVLWMMLLFFIFVKKRFEQIWKYKRNRSKTSPFLSWFLFIRWGQPNKIYLTMVTNNAVEVVCEPDQI